VGLTKVINGIISEMVMEVYTLNREDIIKENGKMIRCKDLGDSIIRMERLLMRDIGKMMNLMDRGEYIMLNQSISRSNLIIRIFLSWVTDGSIMKVSLKMIQSMERVI
jgi:hypothetical protein